MSSSGLLVKADGFQCQHVLPKPAFLPVSSVATAGNGILDMQIGVFLGCCSHDDLSFVRHTVRICVPGKYRDQSLSIQAKALWYGLTIPGLASPSRSCQATVE